MIFKNIHSEIMQKLAKNLVSIFCFMLVFYAPAQETELKIIFKDRKYQKIVDSLTVKQKTATLNFDELFYLAKSYGRLRKYSNGLFVAGEMYNRALKNVDTTNLVRAINVRVENLVDLDTDKEFALDFAEKSLKYFRKQDSVQFQSFCFKLGVLYYQNKDFEKAHKTYQKITLKRFRETGIFIHNYAITLEGLQKYDSAVYYLSKAIKPTQSSNSKLNAYGNIANIYLQTKQYKKAKVYLDSAKLFLTTHTQLKNKRFLFDRLYAYSVGVKKPKEALFYVKKLKEINEDILQEKITEKISSLENSYIREKKLNEDIKVIDEELETSKRRILWGALLSVSLILLLAVISLWYKNKTITQENYNMITEQKLLRSQMTPHFIFNSLSVLQGIILNKEEKKSVLYLSKFSKLLRLILENSREKLVLLKDELLAITNYMDLQKMGARKNFEYTINIKDEIKNKEWLIPPMIIQPFIENAIEHGFTSSILQPKININIFLDKSDLICEIIDNGIGVNSSKENKNNHNKKSLATKITAERMKIFEKQLKTKSSVEVKDISNAEQQGTKVTITIPYKTDDYESNNN